MLHILIPTHNRKELLKKTLLQLVSSSQAKLLIKITVIVDGSSDGTIEMLRNEFMNVSIVNGDGNLWYTRSIILGIESLKASNDDIILLLNDDIELSNNFLSVFIHDFQSLKQDSILGVISLFSNRKRLFFSGIQQIKKLSNRYVPYIQSNKEINYDNLSGIKPSKTLPGRGMMFRYSTYKDVGGFDSKFKQYGSDEEFCLRAGKMDIPSFITYNTMLICNEQETGENSLFKQQSFWLYLKSNFNPYSSNYLLNSLRIIWRYQSKLFFPISVGILLYGRIKAFIRYQYNYE